MIVKSSQNVTVATGAPIPFNTTNIDCCCDSCGTSPMYHCIRTVDATGVQFAHGGLYRVSVDASAATTDAAGNIQIQLALDGVPISYALSIANSTAATDIVGLHIDTVVSVPCDDCGCCCNNHTLTVLNNGIPALYTTATLTVEGVECGC